MEPIKPLVEKRDAGRRVHVPGKRRPLDAVMGLEAEAAKAGFAPGSLDPATRPIALAAEMLGEVLSEGFGAFITEYEGDEAPSSIISEAAQGLHLTKRHDAAQIAQKAAALCEKNPDPAEWSDKVVAEANDLDTALLRAQERASLIDALNDYLVDTPNLLEITEQPLAQAWAARAAALPAATGRLDELPTEDRVRLRDLAQSAGMAADTLRFAPILGGGYRLEAGERRLFARRGQSTHPAGGRPLESWLLKDPETGKTLTADPDSAEPALDETQAHVEALFMKSFGLPEERVRTLLSGNLFLNAPRLRASRIFAPRGFYRLQVAAGEVLPRQDLLLNLGVNAAFSIFLLLFVLPLCIRGIGNSVLAMPSIAATLFFFVLVFGILFVARHLTLFAIAQAGRWKGWRIRTAGPQRFAVSGDLGNFFTY